MLDANQKLQLLIGQQVFQIVALEDHLLKAQARIAELEQTLAEHEPQQEATES